MMVYLTELFDRFSTIAGEANFINRIYGGFLVTIGSIMTVLGVPLFFLTQGSSGSGEWGIIDLVALFVSISNIMAMAAVLLGLYFIVFGVALLLHFKPLLALHILLTVVLLLFMLRDFYLLGNYDADFFFSFAKNFLLVFFGLLFPAVISVSAR